MGLTAAELAQYDHFKLVVISLGRSGPECGDRDQREHQSA